MTDTPRSRQDVSLAMTSVTSCSVDSRRPRNLPAYQAACRASGGDPVEEIVPERVRPDMVLWNGDRFLPVMSVERAGGVVMIDFRVGEPGATAFRAVSLDVPLYRRIPAK